MHNSRTVSNGKSDERRSEGEGGKSTVAGVVSHGKEPSATGIITEIMDMDLETKWDDLSNNESCELP